MAEQVPSVGRIVHYVAYGTPNGEFPAGVCRAAVITEVNLGAAEVTGSPEDSQTTVGLCVLNPTGQFFNRGVRQYEPENVHGKIVRNAGTWHWPERV